MKIAKNFKKIVACLLAFAVVFTCIGSALAVSAEETAIVTNGNGNATDVGIWYTPYNCTEFFAHRFANPKGNPVGYRGLLPDGSYGIPFAGDTDIMDFYIEQMAKAGIDFVLFDTTNGGLSADLQFGWDASEFGGNRWIVAYTKMFAERLSKWNDDHAWKIRYALSVGTYDSAQVEATLADTAEYQAQGVFEAFVSDPVIGDDYYMFDGKPLITLFDWTCVAENQTDIMLKMFEEGSALSKFTVRSSSIGQKGTYSWHNGANDGAAVYDDEVVTVCPGHAQQDAENPTYTRENGAVYQENWDVVLNAEKAPRVVMISSFNDYMENTAVFVTNTDNCVEEYAEEKWETPYQYWDITVNSIKALRAAAGDSTDIDLGYTNYAKKATVTQDHWCLEAAGPLTCINDGSIGNRTLAYANQGSNDHERIYFAFDSAATINNVNLYAPGVESEKYGFKDVAVEVLVDGVWVRVAELHDLSVTNSQLVPVYFAPVKTTKVAIVTNVKNQANKTFASFAEIEIFNNPTVTEADYTGIQAGISIDGLTSANYALGGTVSTNTSIRTNTAKDNNMWTLGNVNDGKLNNFYYGYVSGPSGVNYSKNPYVQVDFDSAKVINNVNFFSCASGEKKYYNDYAVDVKLADGSWKRVATRHYSVEGKIVDSNSQKVAFYFEAVEALAFRITSDTTNCQNALSGGDPNGISQIFSCAEVQAFYYSGATASSYTGLAKPTDSVNIPGVKSANYALAGSGVTVSQGHWCLAAGPLSSINDGTKGNRALAYANQNALFQETITFTFDSAKVINNVNLYADNCEANKYGFKDVAIDVYTTDGVYVRVAELHDLTVTNAQLVPVYFAPVAATKVVVTVDASNQVNTTFASFAEIEIFNDSKDAAYTGIAEATVAGTEIAGFKAANVALNGTLSHSFAKHWSSFESIVDGKVDDSRSCSDFGTAQCAYYQVDFAGGAASINTVNLVWDRLENYTCRDMAVDVLVGNSWKRVAEVHFTEAINWAVRNNVATTFTFEAVKASAIRVWFNKENRVGSLVSLTELEAYYSSKVLSYTGLNAAPSEATSIPGGASSTSSVNYALGQKVTSSNTNWSLFAKDYPADRLTDGVHGQADTAACAISNYVNGQASFTVHFDKAYTINKVITKLSAHEVENTHRADEYIVEVETADGWVRVAIVPGTYSAGHLTDEFYFEAIECTAVRVIANHKATAGANFRLNEIEAYYDSAITEDMYTGAESALAAEFIAGVQGDLDGDKWITAIDLAYAVNAYVGARKVPAGNAAIMDTNRDGKYDIRDYIYLVEEVAIREANLAGLNK